MSGVVCWDRTQDLPHVKPTLYELSLDHSVPVDEWFHSSHYYQGIPGTFQSVYILNVEVQNPLSVTYFGCHIHLMEGNGKPPSVYFVEGFPDHKHLPGKNRNHSQGLLYISKIVKNVYLERKNKFFYNHVVIVETLRFKKNISSPTV